MIVAGQMRHICAVLPIAAETLQFLRMRSDDHDVRAHVKLLFRRLAWPVRNPGARVHVGNAKSIDVLRSASKAVGSPLKENLYQSIPARHAWRQAVDPEGKSIHYYPYGEPGIRHPFGPANPRYSRCRL
jgi:hypothetical protein